jgi:hypothetical protein
MTKMEDSLTRRLLRFMDDDDGCYTQDFLVQHMCNGKPAEEDRERVSNAIYCLVTRGFVLSDRRARLGNRALFKISEPGRDFLDRLGSPVRSHRRAQAWQQQSKA